MIRKSFLLPFAILLLVTSKTFAFAQDVEIPRGPEVTAQSGVPTIIYGQRSRNCDDSEAPDFDRVIGRDPFLDFCRSVIWPISDLERVPPPDLTSIVQEVLSLSPQSVPPG